MKQHVDRLIGKIYDTALAPSGWPALLADIAEVIGAVGGFYAGMDTRRGRTSYWHLHKYPEEIAKLYDERYLLLDPTLSHVIQMPGQVFSSTSYLTDDIYAKHPFYTEFMAQVGMRHVLSAVVSMQGSMVSFFGFQRAAHQAAFGEEESVLMQALIPHFQRLDELAAKISHISETRRLAMAFMDRLDYSVIFVDKSRHICMTNQRAERWLQLGHVFMARFGRIQMKSDSDDKVLAQLLENASGGDMQGGAAITAETEDCIRLEMVVLSLDPGERSHCDAMDASAMIVFSELALQRSLAPQALQRSFGLTPAEVRIALGLASGRTHEEVAENLSISLATVKTHARHVFQKMHINRQVDLVRLIYQLPALT